MGNPRQLLTLFRDFAAGRVSAAQALELLNEGVAEGAPAPSATDEEAALSAGQLALWMNYRLAPDGYAYNVPLAFESQVPLDARTLRRAWRALCERHAALRAVFVERDGEPVQHFAPYAESSFEEMHGPAVGEAYDVDRANRIALIDRLSEQPFSLERGPLARLIWLPQMGRHGVVVLLFHHIVTDGTSLKTIVEELQSLYLDHVDSPRDESRASAGEGRTAPARRTYGEFIAWQRAMLASPAGEEHRRYWAGELAGHMDRLDLFGRRPSATPFGRGELRRVEIDSALRASIQELAIARSVTPYAVMLGTFIVLLHRHSQLDDIRIGTPLVARPESGFASTVGLFTNMTVVRTRIGESERFADLLRQVWEKVRGAIQHGDYPYSKLRDESGHHGSRVNSSFHAACYFQNWRPEAHHTSRNESSAFLEPIRDFNQRGEFDLVLDLVPAHGTLFAYFKYNPDVYTREMIAQLSAQYIELLQGVVREPERELGAYALMGAEEKARVLELGCGDSVAYPSERTFYELFAERAHSHPDTLAVRWQGTRITYGELDRRAAACGRALSARGIARGMTVGILMEHGLGLLVGLLGALRLGVTYVPLDPAYPAERLAFMAKDSGAAAILTQPDLRARTPWLRGIDNVVVLDPQAEGDAAADVPFVNVQPDDLAYVIYTSGSTGNPKGVQTTHRGVVNFLFGMRRDLAFGPSDSTLSITSICFDPSVLELYLPLICGGHLEILPASTLRDGFALKDALDRTAATVLQATPATFEMLFSAGWTRKHAARILCGGEAMTPALATELLARADAVYNVFGPTEATVWNALGRVDAAEARTGHGIPVGRPVQNLQYYVVDRQGHPLPVGVPGELYIGGDGLARGYRNLPEQTAKTFVANRLQLHKSALLYKSGDVARLLPDGRFQCLGRVDHQVKLRGHRIELGGIEETLKKHPAIGNAAVVVSKDAEGHGHLHAFLIAAPGAGELGPDEMKAFVRVSLPEYMVPSRIVYVHEFPLTPSRKVDRKRLASGFVPEGAAPSSPADASFVTLVEREVAALVGAVLKTGGERIDPKQQLGEIGFDSIRFTALSVALRAKWAIEVKPTAFYEHGTVRAIATHLLVLHNDVLGRALAGAEAPNEAVVHETHTPARSVDAVRGGDRAVAIIGMAGRFPRAGSVAELWDKLLAGEDLVTEVPRDRWDRDALYGDPRTEANKTRAIWGGFVRDVDKFDAAFFGISPREAELMDPQHRLFLEAAWHAIEDAGYRPSDLQGSATAVLAGAGSFDYWQLQWQWQQPVDNYTLTGIAHATIANRVSFLLNLAGPSGAVDTACSSSLVAIHRAVKMIQSGECRMALAGGVSLMLSPYLTMAADKAGMMSPVGRCKTFDASADGYVRGEGVGVLFLKALTDAERDGDPIYAVIRGSAENHGGRTGSFTAPNPVAQGELVGRALAEAGFDPATVTYIETHGTGTALGDPIEIDGLKKAFAALAREGASSTVKAHCGLGSVKTSMGHLENAAGIAGVVKTALAMKHGVLPGLLHHRAVNPYIELEGSPFFIDAVRRPWDRLRDARGVEVPRRAGVSSFGFGGANAHVVLEEYVPALRPAAAPSLRVLVVSAKTPEALAAYATRLGEHLEPPAPAEARDPSALVASMASVLGWDGPSPEPEELWALLREDRVALGRFVAEWNESHGAAEIDRVARCRSFRELLDVAGAGHEVRASAASDAALLGDVAYTLHVGREPMRYRVAVAAGDRGEAVRALIALGKGRAPADPLALLPPGALRDATRSWLEGAEIDWRPFYAGEPRRRVHLPGYPFARVRHWLPAAKPSVERAVWRAAWIPRELAPASAPLDLGTVLLVGDGEATVSSIGARLRAIGARTVAVRADEDFGPQLERLAREGKRPSAVIHDCALATESTVTASLERTIFSSFRLTKALIQMGTLDMKWLHVHRRGGARSNAFHGAVSGFHRTMMREKRGYSYKRVEVSGAPSPRDIESLVRELLEEGRPSIEVRYENGERSVRRYVPADVAPAEPPLRRGGTYLITGGAGGIGRVIAEYLRDEWKADVVICGRAKKEDELPWPYLRADVTDSVQVRALIAQVKSRFGGLDGIFHLAGVVRDGAIYNKTETDVRAVLAPKVEGTLQLDEATKDEDLSCFVMFSSLSAIAGNAGQCDYAYANSFMDQFALEREAQVQRGERHGRTISINWPLWREGGMGVSPEEAKRVRERSGVVALDRDDALELVREALQIDSPHIVVTQGVREKIEGALNLDDLFEAPREPAPPADVAPPLARLDVDGAPAVLTHEGLLAELVHFAASILKVAEADVDPELAMSTYGLDSLGLIDLSSRINQSFDVQTVPAIFYEAPTLAALAALLLETWPGLALPAPKTPVPSALRAPAERAADLAEPIAVIGLACVMPGSPDAPAFWQNLVEGCDLVGPRPRERARGFGVLAAGSEEGGAPGGYMEDVDKFDAAFFDIGMDEARLMDPQQRLFLETVWKAIEDAGYRASDLAGSDTALYVGVATADYRDILRESGTPIAEATASGISHCVLANRISHLLDLRGPSEPVDTACSSSLVAIHRGVKALRRGECGLVIAGGVNVILTSLGDELFAKAGVLSKAGRSRPFDAQADGYVRGEGAGAVLLKRLRDAERDGDTIYGLVRGGAQNHGGYSNALTAPNPRAQSEVIQSALRDAGLAMRDVSYVEAHGTGTLLGDSVELNGLVKAVRTSAPGGGGERFWLGSVKGNIGHLETASGIASVIKVLLAMKHGTLPASLHYTSANPYVDGRNNPFEVVRETMPWPRRTDGHGAELPRRAGVSSFGFGGTNAHLVLEEHRPAPRVPSAASFEPIFVLSARSAEQVRVAARNLATFLREPSRRPAPEHEAAFLHDVAYTLHVGREELDVRAAVLASSLDDLVAKLDVFAGGGSSPDAIFSGTAPRRKSIVGGARRSSGRLAARGESGELARGWVSGADMDWKARYEGAAVRRVSLPTYPFVKTVCWVAGQGAALGDAVAVPADVPEITIEASDSLVADHVVRGAKVLPGVALLELARAAGERAGRAVRRLRKIAWEKPVALPDGEMRVRLEVHLDGDRFTIRSSRGPATVVHASGEFAADPGEAPERIDVASVAFGCTEAVSGAEFYRARERAGFAYGPRYRAIAQLRGGESEAIAPLRAFDASYAAMPLEPGVMDAALQAISGIGSVSADGAGGEAASLVPFAVEEVAIHGALSDARYVHASVSPESRGRGLVKYDVRILDGAGVVLVRLARYAARAVGTEALAGAPAYELAFTYDHPSLRDHVVFDERVVLGVTYCSMAIEAMAPRLRDGAVHVQRLFFAEPLALAKGEAATVTIRAGARAEARLPFDVVYAKRGAPGEVLASRGEYVVGGEHGAPERRDWLAIGRRASRSVPVDDVYRATEVHGIRIGDSLRTIASLAYGPGETLARLAMPEGTAPSARMLAEPALLNGAVMSSIFGLDVAPTSPFLPILVKEIHVYAPVGEACWAHSVVRKQNGEVLIVDIALCDDAGAVLLELRELTLKRVRSEPAPRVETAPLDLASLTGEYLRTRVAEALHVAPGEIDDEKNFMDLGLDSASLVALTRQMEKGLGIELFPTLFFEHQNIPELSDFLLAEHRAPLEAHFRAAEPAPLAAVRAAPAPSVRTSSSSAVVPSPVSNESATASVDDGAVAIIGMAGRFAGSANVDEFWEKLVCGEDLIREIPLDHFDYRPWLVQDGQQLDKTYCKWGSFIDDVDKFDAPYFNVSPREAQVMDPQLRVLMETIFHTAEDAGYGKRIRGTNTGMYVGTCFYDYKQEMDRVGKPMGPHDGTGNSPTMMSNRPSFFFNLRGPSLTIDTACSSTLVALHLAASALRNGECEMAFVAGVNLLLCSWHYRYFSAIEALSYSGRCHTFDSRADGYVPGEAVCAVLLKPLARAIADGDRIHAVVRGTAINHGGATQSITAPSVKQEAQVILDAWRAAGVTGDGIGYIEAHGTGTRLGDPIEIDAIKRAFAAGGGRDTRGKTCAVGSAKAHVGHAEGAAGLVGLIKAVLSLQHRTIPAMPKFRELNEFIKLDGSPLYINREPIPWARPAHGPRMAGVSSFGFGGAFAHAVLQEWEAPNERESPRDVREERAPRLFTLSARDPERLNEVCARFEALLRLPGGAFVRGEGELASMPLDRLEATLLLGREEMACRAAFVATSKEELLDGLAALRAGRAEESRGVFTGSIEKATRAKVSPEQLSGWLAARDRVALARAWVGGAKIEWTPWYEAGAVPRPMSLFEYPFARNRYWFPTPPESKGPARASESRQYVPRWVRAELGPSEVARSESAALAFCDGTVRAVFVEAARGRYARLIVVRPGAGFRRIDRDQIEIDPGRAEDYARLVTVLGDEGVRVESVVHLWSVRDAVDNGHREPDEESVASFRARGLHSVFHVVRAFGARRTMALRRFVYAHGGRRAELRPYGEALGGGFAASLATLWPALAFSAVSIDAATSIELRVERVLREAAAEPHERAREVAFFGDVRQVRELTPIEPAITPDGAYPAAFARGDVVLVTGGAGALGTLVARDLLDRAGARVVLMGRSALDGARRATLDALRSRGDVDYVACDVADRAGVAAAVAEIRARYGRLDGVIHAAGTNDGKPVHEQGFDVIARAMRAKVDGLAALDEATRDARLKVFAIFSSVASILGDFGQCHYAVSNRFADAYGELREALRGEGKRHGRTVVVNWPLWRDGGMHWDAKAEARYLKSSRLTYLETDYALALFDAIAGSEGPAHRQVVHFEVDPAHARTFDPRAFGASFEVPVPSAPAPSAPVPSAPVPNVPSADGVRARVRGIAARLLDAEPASLAADASLLELGFDSILLKELAVALGQAFALDVSPSLFFNRDTLAEVSAHLIERAPAPCEEPPPSAHEERAPADAIAIIGISARFPGAPDLESFWRDLEAKSDRVTEIPVERWDWSRDFYEGARITKRRSISKWGGFLEDADKFDAEFFRIAPTEAEVMDPQHRVFLEASWKAIEDAGYAPSSLAGKAMGVFAGVQFNDYLDAIRSAGDARPQIGTGNSHAMLANRVSFVLDLHGPSEAIDTACSSSLVAVHRAIASLQRGECEMALAGGVSLVTEQQYVVASQLGMLSPDGRCKPFDARANGFVKGEGVGVLLLKPLARAVADRDPIWAVVRGSAVNHGGRASSLTAPDPKAQASVVRAALADAGVDAWSLGYVEAHGTGTELGDPVEVDGLNEALAAPSSTPARVCVVGSVKSNIGHLEAASGMAGLVKVVLALRKKCIPGTVHFQALNPHVRLGARLAIAAETSPWAPFEDEHGRPLPRRAGVSAFGYGGANAHVVLEEWSPEPDARDVAMPHHARYLVPLSAKTEPALRTYAALLREHLAAATTAGSGPRMQDVAYTLCAGRDAYEHRVVFVAGGVPALVAALDAFLNGVPGSSWYLGTASDESVTEDASARRISLPSYPFERARHWIGAAGERVFHVELTGAESFLVDHRIQGRKVLPATAHLELARRAGSAYARRTVTRMRDVVWSKPVVVEGPLRLTIELTVRGGELEFAVASGEGVARSTHARGWFAFDAPATAPFDAEAASKHRARCADVTSSAAHYASLSAHGYEYGPSFRAVRRLLGGEREAVAELSAASASTDEDALDPGLLDGAFQAIVAPRAAHDGGARYLPYALAEIAFLRPVRGASTAFLSLAPSDGAGLLTADLRVVGDDGEACIAMTGLAFRAVGAEARPAPEAPAAEPPNDVVPADARAAMLELLAGVIAEETGTPRAKLRASDPFEKYGIDSVMILSLTGRLEAIFGRLSRTLFFEHRTLAALAAHLAEHHASALPRPAPPDAPAPRAEVPAARAERAIAIVGMAARFPMAGDLDAFWANLTAGRDCITEVPAERWNHAAVFAPEKGKLGATYGKWGGFLDGVDLFDAKHFKIAPRDAIWTDPQERLFLETAWGALQDAGYAPESVRGARAGVYVGVMYGQYQLLGAEVDGREVHPGGSYASIANRVSYTFDLRGPSIALDTMCSSSLTAIKLACDHLRLGDTDLAIAGGVNVTIHPNKYTFLGQGRYLSSDGRCRSFGEGGDGYVPGEGVGAVVLKRLDRAVRDGDVIHGVIRAITVNHGGKTNGYTVPNPDAQRDLILAALEEAKVHPRAVSYLEAHGTGTALGDPIEIRALASAFESRTRDRGFCAVGSVKSNIGHLESAAGVAGLVKVLLQMKHGKLVPSLHAERINPNIDMDASPFVVQRRLADWERPTWTHEGRTETAPRIAGISSFGAGGANAHVIMEQYEPLSEASAVRPVREELVVLSAPSKALLRRYAESLLAVLAQGDSVEGNAAGAHGEVERIIRREVAVLLAVSEGDIDTEDDWSLYGFGVEHGAQLAEVLRERLGSSLTAAAIASAGSVAALTTRVGGASQAGANHRARADLDLTKLAFTLQTGREAMEERVAFVAADRRELEVALRRLCAGEVPARGAQGTVTVEADADPVPAASLARDHGLEAVGRAWTSGTPIDWASIHDASPPGRLALPAPPLDRKRYWVDSHVGTTHKVDSPAARDHVDELRAHLAETLLMSADGIDVDKPFTDLGMDSVAGTQWIDRINARYGTAITATATYEYPTVRKFARFLAESLRATPKAEPAVVRDASDGAPVARPSSLRDVLHRIQRGGVRTDDADQWLRAALLEGEL